MREEDKQAYGPDMHRPLDKQEIQEPNEGDPERRELGHLVGQTAEAQIGVFETGAPSAIDGNRPSVGRIDADAVQGPGGDSRPDLIDPATAQFTRVDGDAMQATPREEFPEPARDLVPEMESQLPDDDLVVSARPDNSPLDHEIAVLEHSQQKMKDPKEAMDR